MQTTYLGQEFELLIWQKVLQHKYDQQFWIGRKVSNNGIKSQLSYNKMTFYCTIIETEIKTQYQWY